MFNQWPSIRPSIFWSRAGPEDFPFAPRWSQEPNTKQSRLCIFGAAAWWLLIEGTQMDPEVLMSFADPKVVPFLEDKID